MSLTPFIPPATVSLLPRGNQLLQSNSFATTWAATAMTVGSNTQTDQYGLTTADTLTRTATTASFLGQGITAPAAQQPFTFSVNAQLKTNNFFAMAVHDGAGVSGRADVCFNLATGAISLAPTASGTIPFTNVSATITPIAGTSLYRCTLSGVTASNTAISCYVSSSSVSQVVDATGSANGSAVYISDAQFEWYAQASATARTTTAADSGIWAGTQGLAVLPFLPGQAVVISKAPKWSTQRIQAASGRVRKTAYWPFPLWQFELQYEVVRHRPSRDELMQFWEFFNAAQGQFGNWLFVDPSDCYVPSTSPDVFGTGDGSTKTFQMSRTLFSGVNEPVYDVYQPVILDNGSPTASSLTFSPNGQVTFGTAPANGHTLSWFGYFFFGCEFLQDDLTFEQIVPLLWSGKSLKFSSLRP